MKAGWAPALLLLAAACRMAAAQSWEFEVRLDGKPIGTHRFAVTGPAAAREVESSARFDVKLLGFSVYRYLHDARERWQGDCLREIQSRTEDGGEPAQVDRRFDAAAPGEPACLMSFAYWNPRLLEQGRLLNPQTGLIEDLRAERLADATLAARGREVAALRWRLLATNPTSGAKQEITLWLDRGDGSWIGLDARVKGGRLLTYRLP